MYYNIKESEYDISKILKKNASYKSFRMEQNPENNDMPSYDMPSYDMPNSNMPNNNFPNGNMPNYDMPNFNMPNNNFPNGNMPNYDMPNNNFPENWNNIPENWRRAPLNNGNNNQTSPLFPIQPNETFNKNREMELMQELYSAINTALYPFVLEVLDGYEFIGSPIYSILGIDRETIAQIVDQVIDLAETNLDQVGEAKAERTGNYLREWDRWGLLRSTVESLVLNEIFCVRRPEYFGKYAPSILKKD